MDLVKDTEILLRDAAYVTRQWAGSDVPMISFENETIIGFVHFFDSSDRLLREWESIEDKALKKFRFSIKSAGQKAWNVYSVFLSSDQQKDESQISLTNIEENFRETRKIARDGVDSFEGIRAALLPLLPIQNSPLLDEVNFVERLSANLGEIHRDGADAFLRGGTAHEIAEILAEKE